MKHNLIDEIKSIYTNSIEWAQLEIRYAKLTLAEKLSIIAGFAIMGAIVMVLALPLVIMLLFALDRVFALMMNPILAFLSTAAVVLILIVSIYLLRKPLIFNPVAKFITRLINDNNRP